MGKKNTGHQLGGKFQSVLFAVVESTCCTTQKYRLLYTIKYGTIQPMMKSDILRLRKKTQLSQTEASHR